MADYEPEIMVFCKTPSSFGTPRIWKGFIRCIIQLLLIQNLHTFAGESADFKIFKDGEQPTRPYRKVKVFTDEARTSETQNVEAKMLREAIRLGADAIIFHDKVPLGKGYVLLRGKQMLYMFKATAISYEGLPTGQYAPGNQKADGGTVSSGTCFFISDDGYLLTAAHVVSGATRVVIKYDGEDVPASLIRCDLANDVALLKANKAVNGLALAPSRVIKLGQPVFTIGFPNTQLQGTEPKLTRGEISSTSGLQDDPTSFQISVPVQPGNSGGPLLTEAGEVAGLITSRLSDRVALRSSGALPQTVNYAVKSAFIAAFLESIPDISAKLKTTESAADSSGVLDKCLKATALLVAYSASSPQED
jgi:S1-C subfamily serine protease